MKKINSIPVRFTNHSEEAIEQPFRFQYIPVQKHVVFSHRNKKARSGSDRG